VPFTCNQGGEDSASGVYGLVGDRDLLRAPLVKFVFRHRMDAQIVGQQFYLIEGVTFLTTVAILANAVG